MGTRFSNDLEVGILAGSPFPGTRNPGGLRVPENLGGLPIPDNPEPGWILVYGNPLF